MGLTERVRDTVARLEVEVAPQGLDSLMKWAERALYDELDGFWYPIGHDVRRAADVVALAAEDFDELEAVVTCEEKRAGAAGRRRKRLRMSQPNPDRTTWTHTDGVGWVRPMVDGPVRTNEEWEAEVERLDKQRAARARKLMRESEKAGNRRPMTDDERRDLAFRLGARMSRDTARNILCPQCRRRSVWFYVSMAGHTFGGAACSHRNSCGWAGSPKALEAR